MGSQSPRLGGEVSEAIWIWLKDHPEKTKVQHMRDALEQYVKSYGQAIGPDTKVTIATPEGPKPYATIRQAPPTYTFGPDDKPEIDASTGKPIDP